MSFSDFMRSWDCVQMCHLTLDSFSAELEHSEHVKIVYYNRLDLLVYFICY